MIHSSAALLGHGVADSSTLVVFSDRDQREDPEPVEGQGLLEPLV